MKKTLAIVTGVLSVSALAVEPSIKEGSVTMTQASGSREVTITYEVENGPAIVTVDIFTNCTASSFGASIGGGNLWTLGGEINRKVSTGEHSFTWLPHLESWGRKMDSDTRVEGPKFSEGVRAVVTAWSLARPPDYMVVDIPSGTFSYYPSEDFLPRGVHAAEYKTQKLVMRLVPAAKWTTPWVMGSLQLGPILLTKNYYLGVFELTQKQYKNIGGSYSARHSDPNVFPDWEFMPMERYTTFVHARLDGTYDKTVADADLEPEEPVSTSILGMLNASANAKSEIGMVFDLPTEAEWEFACCAGRIQQPINVEGKTINEVAWHQSNTTYWESGKTYPPHIDGKLAHNAWGFYDMIGNVAEFCRDFYTGDANRWATMAAEFKNGDNVYVDPIIGKSQTDKSDYWSQDGNKGNRVRRGGGSNLASNAAALSSIGRDYNNPTFVDNNTGIRVACRPVTAQ